MKAAPHMSQVSPGSEMLLLLLLFPPPELLLFPCCLGLCHLLCEARLAGQLKTFSHSGQRYSTWTIMEHLEVKKNGRNLITSVAVTFVWLYVFPMRKGLTSVYNNLCLSIDDTLSTRTYVIHFFEMPDKVF